MKMTAKDGKPAVWYDQLQQRQIDEAMVSHLHDHECGPECDPPSEAALMAFYESLTTEQRKFCDFLAYLYHWGHRLPATMWKIPPVEAMETKGEH